jgi:hypothetical protein
MQSIRRQYVRMETNSGSSSDTSSNAPARDSAPLRIAGRPDTLTAQRVEVGIILQAMLGTHAAAEYLKNNDVPRSVALRVLFQHHLRRGRHDASGIRC